MATSVYNIGGKMFHISGVGAYISSGAAGNLAAGIAAIFESAATSHISVCMMDSTHAIVCYLDAGNSGYGTACCLTLSGTTVTAGTPVVFESTNSRYLSICKMDSTHAIVSYARDGAGTSYGTACCLSLSETTISAGTPVVFRSQYSTYTSICMMDSTHAIVCYADSGGMGSGSAICLTLSETTISVGDRVEFNTPQSYYNTVCRMDSTHAIVCYYDSNTSSLGYGTACCLTLSGTTITADTPVVFESAMSQYTSVCMMDSTHAIVCYEDGGNIGYGTACCLTLSGTTITADTPVVFESADSLYTSVCRMDSTHAIVCYGSGGEGKARCLTLSGTAITAGTQVVFESAVSLYFSACMMDSTHAIVCYRDDGNSYYGTACALTLS